MFQKKEQDKFSEQLSEVEIGNLPKRIKSNDSKDDPSIDQEIHKMLNKELENL